MLVYVVHEVMRRCLWECISPSGEFLLQNRNLNAFLRFLSVNNKIISISSLLSMLLAITNYRACRKCCCWW